MDLGTPAEYSRFCSDLMCCVFTNKFLFPPDFLLEADPDRRDITHILRDLVEEEGRHELR